MCKTLVHPQVYGVVRVPHLFSILCCAVFLCYVCLRPVSCVLNVASVSGLSFLTSWIK
jgi:hypothetical protein